MLDGVDTLRRLTSFSHGAGCGCKLGPDQLNEVLTGLTLPRAPDDLLVGTDTGDDAAAWRLDDGRALIATLDFFTPIVDDPYDWGRIAATNAMSDVYAMGGTPLFGLNIVSWPIDDLPAEMLGRVLQGGVDAASAAGVAVVGGHSITDPEPKYGMVVVGLAAPEALITNAGARAGDHLFLTKPLGLGMISTALKRGDASDDLVATAIDLMTTTNASAADAMVRGGASAGTDVTGFGLLGHLHRMALASGLAARIRAADVPLIRGALELARSGVAAGGTRRNRALRRAGDRLGRPPRSRAAAAGRRSDERGTAHRRTGSWGDGGGPRRARRGLRRGRARWSTERPAPSRSRAVSPPRNNRPPW